MVLNKVERMLLNVGFSPVVLLPASFTLPSHPASEFSRSHFQFKELLVSCTTSPKWKVRERNKFSENKTGSLLTELFTLAVYFWRAKPTFFPPAISKVAKFRSPLKLNWKNKERKKEKNLGEIWGLIAFGISELSAKSSHLGKRWCHLEHLDSFIPRYQFPLAAE